MKQQLVKYKYKYKYNNCLSWIIKTIEILEHKIDYNKIYKLRKNKRTIKYK